MPLVEPELGGGRREKILLCARTKVGKTTCMMSVMYAAWKSGDTRHFWIIDCDDTIPDVLLEEKYQGMNNYDLIMVDSWEDYLAASEKVVANAQKGDWIFGDMVDRGWKIVQDWERMVVAKSSRADTILDAAKSGATGWDLFREINWVVVNSQWDLFIKPILLRSPAHLFFTTEQTELPVDSSKKTSEQKRDIQQFGSFKPAGQKSLPYQVRTILRMDRLARGRVLYTLGDRARRELDGEVFTDFLDSYLRGVAGWSIEMPSKEA